MATAFPTSSVDSNPVMPLTEDLGKASVDRYQQIRRSCFDDPTDVSRWGVAGDMHLVEDTTGRGHHTRVVGDEELVLATVHLPA